MSKTPYRRYVKFMFSGYAPVDLAIQLHLIGKNTDVNMVGEDMKPYTEYLKEYDKLYQSTKEKDRQRNIIDDWFDKAEHYQITDVMKYELLEMLDLPREDYDFNNDKNLLYEEEKEWVK